MLKFFRRIRLSLIHAGKTRGYLLYAVGEVALVVIGILIALQINNWNENQKNGKVEREYLIALKDEFEENYLILKENIELNKDIMNGIGEMLALTGPAPPSLSVEEFVPLWKPIMSRIPNFEPGQAVLDDLISSGNLSKISNIQLRRGISEWKAFINKSSRFHLILRGTRDDAWNIFMEKGPVRSIVFSERIINIGKSKFDVSLKTVLSDLELENRLSIWMAASNGLDVNYYQELDSQFVNILDMINRELEK